MRINRSLLDWGVFLIALGGIPLAVDQGWLASDIARELGQLWPLILVGIGLGLILRWTPFAWFGGALVAATFGIIIGAAAVALPDDDIDGLQGVIPAVVSGACAADDAGPASTTQGSVADPDAFELYVSLACGELAISRAAETSWGLQAAHALDDAPSIRERDLDGATSYLGLVQADSGDLAFLARQQPSDWSVQVPASAALTVGATLNAVKADLRLGAGPLTRVTGTLNASVATIDLADALTPIQADVELSLNASKGRLVLPDGSVRADVTLNASSLGVCIPAGASLQVQLYATGSNDDLASSGLQETSPGRWDVPGAAAVGDGIVLSIDSNLSSLSVERPETCS